MYGLWALSGKTRASRKGILPPVCCPWRNRASGIPPIEEVMCMGKYE